MSRASKVKGSRLKSSTKNVYNDVLKNHFLEWLRQNQNNATVKKFKNVFKLNRRNEHGFTMHKFCDTLMETMNIEKPKKKKLSARVES